MKKIQFLYVILSVYALISCTFNTKTRKDTLYINSDQCAIVFKLTNQEMNDERLCCMSKEVFELKLEDSWFNRYLASEYFNNRNIKLIEVDTNYRYIKFVKSNPIDLTDTAKMNLLTDMLIFRNDSQPAIVPLNNIFIATPSYFDWENELAKDYIPIGFGGGKSTTNNFWYGTYNVYVENSLNDWRDDIDLELIINESHIEVILKGYQLYKDYQLSMIKEDINSITLVYYQAIEKEIYSNVLKETMYFGRLEYENDEYLWKNVKYINRLSNVSDTTTYYLKKQKSMK